MLEILSARANQPDGLLRPCDALGRHCHEGLLLRRCDGRTYDVRRDAQSNQHKKRDKRDPQAHRAHEDLGYEGNGKGQHEGDAGDEQRPASLLCGRLLLL